MVRLYTRIGTSGSWPAWINAFIGAPDGCNLINTLNASATWGGGTDYTYQGDSDIYAEADCNGLSCSYGVSEIWFVLIGKLQSSYGEPLC